MDKRDFCDIVNSERPPAIDGKEVRQSEGCRSRWSRGGPTVARRNALSYVAALLQTTRRRPVSGLASDESRRRSDRLPTCKRSGVMTGWNLLTVAGAAPALNRIESVHDGIRTGFPFHPAL